MVRFLTVGAIGIFSGIVYASGYIAQALTGSAAQTALVAQNNIPDFSNVDAQKAFKKAVTDLRAHLDEREELNLWQLLWKVDNPQPYLQLAAQVDMLRAWLMGVSQHVRTEQEYRQAKKVAHKLICPQDQQEANDRLINQMREGSLPDKPFSSFLCDRVRTFQPQIAKRIESSLCMEGPNRYAYDTLKTLGLTISQLYRDINAAIALKREAHAAFRWVWWIYQPSDTTHCADTVEKTAKLAARTWAQLMLSSKGAAGHKKRGEFTPQALQAAEIGRQVLAHIEHRDFKTFYKNTYDRVQAALHPVKKGLLGSLDSPLNSFNQFDDAAAVAALNKNLHLLTES